MELQNRPWLRRERRRRARARAREREVRARTRGVRSVYSETTCWHVRDWWGPGKKRGKEDTWRSTSGEGDSFKVTGVWKHVCVCCGQLLVRRRRNSKRKRIDGCDVGSNLVGSSLQMMSHFRNGSRQLTHEGTPTMGEGKVQIGTLILNA